jgi:hypothetical protein
MSHIDAAGIKNVCAIQGLVCLNFSDCQNLNSTSLSPLSKLPKLKQLNLAQTQVDDDFFASTIISSLRVLNIQQCNRITNNGIHSICKNWKIQELDISDCAMVGTTGLAFLSLTNIKFKHTQQIPKFYMAKN